MIVRYIILGFSLILAIGCFGQVASLDVLNGKKKMSVSFEYRQGFILIPFKYQFIVPMTLIFDTGAQNTIIFDKRNTDLINTVYSKEIKIKGADYSNDVSALIARDIYLSTANHDIGVERDILVLKEDIVNLGELVGQDIHGILGASFFKGLIVEIDYRRKRITFHDPNHFNPSKYPSYHRLPLKIDNQKPYVLAEPYISESKSDSLLFLVDTGASIALMLQSDIDSLFELSKNVIPGSLGKGMGGDIMGYVTTIDSLMIAGLNINRPITYFQKFNALVDVDNLFRDGIIGNTILERFSIVIDYHNAWIYLKPNKDFDKEFKYDKSGMNIIAGGENHNEFIVTTVVKNSPAALADIRKGDQIVKINWRGKLFLDINYINNKLAGPEGKRIRLIILRDGIKLKKEITLIDLLR